MINPTNKYKVLFICTGNYYRSRFAEIYFNHLNKEGKWFSFSRGINTGNPNNIGKISPFTIKKLETLNIPLPEVIQIPTQLVNDDLKNANIIIGLDENEHKPVIFNRYPTFQHLVQYWHIQDIYLLDPNEALELLKIQVEHFAQSISHTN